MSNFSLLITGEATVQQQMRSREMSCLFSHANDGMCRPDISSAVRRHLRGLRMCGAAATDVAAFHVPARRHTTRCPFTST